VGDGQFRAELEELARKLRVNTLFLGTLPRAEVLEVLDQADLFVLASKTEGLPRALIEAMARGLPCIATAVGGVPELLPREHLVEPNSASALADAIAGVLGDVKGLQHAAEYNWRTAREYHEDVLAAERRRFYADVRLITEAWLKRRTPTCVAA
jgi:glycosyltransferase involved in cell wall biosynthesis